MLSNSRGFSIFKIVKLSSRLDLSRIFLIACREQALLDYKLNHRRDADEQWQYMPDETFPQDGLFNWAETPDDPGFWRICYHEGPKDIQWRAKRDQNYRTRLEREPPAVPQNLLMMSEACNSGHDALNQGDVEQAHFLFSMLSTKVALLKNSANTASSSALSRLYQSTQRGWLLTQFILLLDAPERLSNLLLHVCFYHTETVTELRLTYTLAMIAHRDERIDSCVVNTLLVEKLYWLAENRILNDNLLTLFKAIAEHACHNGLITDAGLSTLVSLAAQKETLSESLLNELSDQVAPFENQFQQLVCHYFGQVYALTPTNAMLQKNLTILEVLLDQLGRKAAILERAQHKPTLKKMQAQRLLQFCVVKMTLCFSSSFSVNSLSSINDFSDLLSVGKLLLNTDTNTIGELLQQGQLEKLSTIPVNHLATQRIEATYYTPKNVVQSWSQTAVALLHAQHELTNSMQASRMNLTLTANSNTSAPEYHSTLSIETSLRNLFACDSSQASSSTAAHPRPTTPPLAGIIRQATNVHGYSTNRRVESSVLLANASRLALWQQEAVSDYRLRRQSDSSIDHPKHKFPQDGQFSWAQKIPGHWCTRYVAGERDKAWMAEGDESYLARVSSPSRKRGREPGC
jgi:hypothetical protein